MLEATKKRKGGKWWRCGGGGTITGSHHFYHLISTKYFTDTGDWGVMAPLRAWQMKGDKRRWISNEREVERTWKEKWGSGGHRFMVS